VQLKPSGGNPSSHPTIKGEHLQEVKGKKGYPLGQEIMENATEGTIKRLSIGGPDCRNSALEKRAHPHVAATPDRLAISQL
jgi:hypothetical protein